MGRIKIAFEPFVFVVVMLLRIRKAFNHDLRYRYALKFVLEARTNMQILGISDNRGEKAIFNLPYMGSRTQDHLRLWDRKVLKGLFQSLR